MRPADTPVVEHGAQLRVAGEPQQCVGQGVAGGLGAGHGPRELAVEGINAAGEVSDARVLDDVADVDAHFESVFAVVPGKRVDKLTDVLFARIGREAAIADGPVSGGLEQRNAVDVGAVECALEAKLLPELLVRRRVDGSHQPVIGQPRLIHHRAVGERPGPVDDAGFGVRSAHIGVAAAGRQRQAARLQPEPVENTEAHEHGVVVGDSPVHLGVVLVRIEIAWCVKKIVLDAGTVRRRVETQYLDRHGIDAAGRDRVVRKLRARCHWRPGSRDRR